MRQKTVITKLLQRVTEVYYKVHQVLQSVTEVYYKVRQVLHSASGTTKWKCSSTPKHASRIYYELFLRIKLCESSSNTIGRNREGF